MAPDAPPDRSDLPDLLHAHFHARAAERPDAVALHFGSRSVRYGPLAGAARRVAEVLRDRGIGPGCLVGLHAERSPEWVAAALGVLEAGAAVTPLPPSDPEGRTRGILEFGGLAAVLEGAGSRLELPAGTHRLELGAVLGSALAGAGAGDGDGVRAGVGDEVGRESAVGAEAGAPAVPGDAFAARGLPDPPDPPAGAPTIGPDAPAFVLSSSGSTGHPKLIVRSHRSFFHRLRWTWARHPFGPGDVGCQKAHMTTTHSLYELFEPLLSGAPTCIVPDEGARDLEGFWETVRQRGVTRLLLVPSALRATLELPGFRPPPLEVLVLMGEYVPPELAVRAVEAFPETTALYSIYGSTEASSTLLVDLRASARAGEELPLGDPIAPEVEARVLDEDLREVGSGGEGRLYMAGPPLFSGYWNDREATDAVLVPAPDGDGLLYDTRDRVRRTPDGRLHFLGRVDHVVKIRGFRVELPEVERALRAHPEVRQAAAGVEGEGTPQAALVAFHVPASVDRDHLFDFLRDRLPPYMVPSALVGREAFPRTESHKIDRRRLLREWADARAGEDGEAVPAGAAPAAAAAPSPTATEERVVEAWEATLGHRRFGRDQAFFEVGGTSLTAFSVVHHLRQTFGLDRAALSVETLYRHPTVASLAARLDGEGGGTVYGGGGEEGRGPGPGTAVPLTVTLRGAAARAPGLPEPPPLFVVASAGGTLGAYERLAAALSTDRAVVGIRDPFLWGDRDPWDGFRRWLDRYEEALLARQPEGPYHLCAYSSAGAFGWELARRLRAAGREVRLLALVDPLALDRGSPRRFGHWALRATWAGRRLRTGVRAAGLLRGPALGLLRALGRLPSGPPPDHALSREEFEAVARHSRESTGHLMAVSALLELNTGLPFALETEDFDGVAPEDRLGVFLDRVAELTPEVDRAMLERLVVQYEDQIRAQHAYRLSPLDAPVLLVEPETPHAGLLAAQIRPYARTLVARRLPLGPQEGRERAVASRFGGLQGHYRSMRDGTFVAGLAREVERMLEG